MARWRANPRWVSKALRFDLEGLGAWPGDCRIVYRITDQVTILAVEHRADVYQPR